MLNALSYCDNSAQNGGGPAADGNTGCSMQCQGDSNEICGGPDRLSVWEHNLTGLASTSPSSTTGIGGATATNGSGNGNGGGATSPTPSNAVNATAILPWKYQGCYTDNSPNGRTLKNQQPDNKTLTVESCIAMCTSLGYTIAGMEYSDQCFCDNYIRNSPSLVSDAKCSMGCAGNSGEMCGAGSILSVYSNGTMTDYLNPTPQNSSLPGSWKYQGCLADNDAVDHVLPYKMVFPTNNSNTNCLSICQQFGYGAGGTEYAQEW